MANPSMVHGVTLFGVEPECTMDMSVHWGYGDCILIKHWRPDNAKDFIISCIVLVLLCIVREYTTYSMKYYEIRSLTGKYMPFWPSEADIEEMDCLNVSGDCVNPLISPIARDYCRQPITLKLRVIDCLLHGLSLIIGYGMMLVVMTFNIGLILTIVIGYCLGRFIFDKQSKVMSRCAVTRRNPNLTTFDSDHCRVRS